MPRQRKRKNGVPGRHPRRAIESFADWQARVDREVEAMARKMQRKSATVPPAWLPARNEEPPLNIPDLLWSREARRFLKAAIAVAEDIEDRWFEEEAIWLERALDEAKDYDEE